jgi:hypothetical protein
MAGFEALGLGNARDVILRGLRLVAGLAEDLKVIGFVHSPKCEG